MDCVGGRKAGIWSGPPANNRRRHGAETLELFPCVGGGDQAEAGEASELSASAASSPSLSLGPSPSPKMSVGTFAAGVASGVRKEDIRGVPENMNEHVRRRNVPSNGSWNRLC